MDRFVGGAVACLLLMTVGLFWWQGRAENEREAPPVKAAPAVPAPLSLPKGDSDAIGKAPPMPPEAKAEDREARRFNRYDIDRDGIITRLEMMSSRTDDFRKLDKDGNNLLSFEEWAVRTSDRFAGADADKDNRLTRTEFATTATKRKPKPKCKC